MNRRAAILGLVGAVLLLAGCGRRSQPKAPEGSTYGGTDYPTRPAMGLPKQDPPAVPVPDDDDLDGNDTPVPGIFAPPPPRGVGR